MEFFPIFINLKDKPCLVIGGGEIASRKVDLLLKAHAKITLVSPKLNHYLQALLDKHRIDYIAQAFKPEHINQQRLIVVATNDADINQTVSELAQQQNIPVNVVDNPKLCSFIMPSIIQREPVVIAISTGGNSPVLARLIRGKLEALIPASYGELAKLATRFRHKVKQSIAKNQRRSFWEKILQGPMAELVFNGQIQQAEQRVEQLLQNPEQNSDVGEVYLVGGGPGDPELLTLKALRLMQQADIIVYDRLVSPEVLELTRRDAERIYVGKARNNHTMDQENINQLLVRLAQEGKRVLRLKGGDPFIFGRGGEEIDLLAKEKIPFQVVPGITAASGCSAYAGIPLTHRDYAQSCLFVTGHRKDGSIDLNWKTLAQPNQTVVFYMGLLGVEIICQKLVEYGMRPSTPIALIQQGTTQSQKVLSSTLENLSDMVKQVQPKPPTLIIVGEVVKLQPQLTWFESKLSHSHSNPLN